MAANTSQSPSTQNTRAVSKRSMATALQTSPVPRQTPGSSGLDENFESPFVLDYDADYDNEAGFDYDQSLPLDGEMIGSLPGEPYDENDIDQGEKRKSFDDEEDDDEGGGKRQETDEKSAKKPGRKPLTSEPTTKRKAQNRAAQRAFRERKEKHLKDLETKVTDLEKASESANHENTILRSQVGRLTTELSEYRKRLAASVTGTSPGGSSYNRYSWHNSGNDFQFDFPAFGSGVLPPESKKKSENGTREKSSTNGSDSTARSQPQRAASHGSVTSNAMSLNQASFTSSPEPVSAAQAFGDLFSPSILASVNMSPGSDYLSHKGSTSSQTNGSRMGSVDRLPNNSSVPQLNGGSSNSFNSASPSASSVSQHGPGSSNETSPEPSGNSPTKIGDHSLNPIDENGLLRITDSSNAFMTKSPSAEPNSIDWLAQQNGGQFAPDLFGGYREPQEAVVSDYTDGFFNEAFQFSDLAGSPVSPGDALVASSTPAPKKNPMENMDRGEEKYFPRAEAGPDMLNLNNVWDRIQKDESYQNGECDIDGLCQEMKKKARCTERGLAVRKDDVDELLKAKTA